MVATLSAASASPRPSTTRTRRQGGWQRQRLGRRSRNSSITRIAVPDRPSSLSPQIVILVCLLVVACCSSSCSSFVVPHQRTQKPVVFQKQMQPNEKSFDRRFSTTSSTQTPTCLFVDTIINGSTEENVSSKNDDPETVGESDGVDASSSPLPLPPTSNLEFDDAAESLSPPLNFEKYLTMQKKRVPVTIRYSRSSGLKPYYLTVAKRVKDQYPDVLIERIEVSGDDGGGSESMDGDASSTGTFEVIVDGKIVVRTNQRAGNGGSIFVSMTEMELAIARARRRRRPSTAYGENGIAMAGKLRENEEEYGKSRLEVLRQKAQELQRNKEAGGINNNNAGSD